MEFVLSSVPGSGLISCLGICSLNQETMFLYLENNNLKIILQLFICYA